MDYRLVEKFRNLAFGLAMISLFSACLFKGGHLVAAAVVAIVLLLVIIAILLFEDRFVPQIDLPDSTLGMDLLIIVGAIVCFCLEESEAVYRFVFGMWVFGFVGAVLDVILLAGKGSFKDKTFKELFHEQLRFPIELDIVLLFWPIYDGYRDGWDTIDTFTYVYMGLLVLDLIHNLIILPSVRRKEKQIVQDYLRQLEEEKDSLVSVDTDTAGLDEETRKLVIDRINLIDHILIGRMAGNAVSSRKANKEIEKVIADRASFIESLALQYAVSHPQAIDRLQQCGLSRYEIGLCCLYHMGYNGKEVKDISDTSMVYHVNSTIRQKLGLKANDINLTTFIRELFGAL